MWFRRMLLVIASTVLLTTLAGVARLADGAPAAPAIGLLSARPSVIALNEPYNLTLTGRAFPPVGARILIHVYGPPLSPAVDWTGNATVRSMATPTSAGRAVLRGVPAMTGGEGTLNIRVFDPNAGVYDSPSSVSVYCYDPIQLTNLSLVSPNTIQPLGFTQLTLVLARVTPLNLPAVWVKLCARCDTAPADTPCDVECQTVQTSVDAYSGTTLTFMTPAFVGSGYAPGGGTPVTVQLSVDGGYVWHFASLANAADPNEPLLRFSPSDVLRTALLYPFPIIGSEWVASHQVARFELERAFGSRLAVRVVPNSLALPDGTRIDEGILRPLLNPVSEGGYGAQFVILAGTQYMPTLRTLAVEFPRTQFLMFSTVRSGMAMLRPNIAFSTGRMYEALYLAGIAAGSVTRNNRIGFVMTMAVPSVRAMLNAFTLGVSHTNPNATVFSWLINTFQDSWTETAVTLNFIDVQNVDVLVPVSSGYEATTLCAQRNVFAISFNSDLRAILNDHIFCSVRFEWRAAYVAYATKALMNQTFGPISQEVSMAEGAVSIGSFSPYIPSAVLSLIAREQQRLMQLPWSERVFCATHKPNTPIRASNGTVMLKPGECITPSAYSSMNWLTDGVVDLGIFVPPLQYEIVYFDSHIFALLCVLAGVIGVYQVANLCAIIWYRNTAIFRASSADFCLATTSGSIAMTVAGIVFGLSDVAGDEWGISLDARTTICRTKPSLLGLSFILLFGPVVVKAYRLAVLFDQSRLSRSTVSDRQLWLTVSVLVLIEVVINVGWCELSPISSSLIVSVDKTTAYYQCTSPDTTFWLSMSLTYKFALLAVGLVLAFRGRNLPTAFNETPAIVGVVYAITVLCAIVVPLSTHVATVSAYNTLIISGTLFVSCVTVTVLFATKNYVAITQSHLNVGPYETTSVVQLSKTGSGRPLKSALKKPSPGNSDGTNSAKESEYVPAAPPVSVGTFMPAVMAVTSSTRRPPRRSRSRRSAAGAGGGHAARSSHHPHSHRHLSGDDGGTLTSTPPFQQSLADSPPADPTDPLFQHSQIPSSNGQPTAAASSVHLSTTSTHHAHHPSGSGVDPIALNEPYADPLPPSPDASALADSVVNPPSPVALSPVPESVSLAQRQAAAAAAAAGHPPASGGSDGGGGGGGRGGGGVEFNPPPLVSTGAVATSGPLRVFLARDESSTNGEDHSPSAATAPAAAFATTPSDSRSPIGNLKGQHHHHHHSHHSRHSPAGTGSGPLGASSRMASTSVAPRNRPLPPPPPVPSAMPVFVVASHPDSTGHSVDRSRAVGPSRSRSRYGMTTANGNGVHRRADASAGTELVRVTNAAVVVADSKHNSSATPPPAAPAAGIHVPVPVGRWVLSCVYSLTMCTDIISVSFSGPFLLQHLIDAHDASTLLVSIVSAALWWGSIATLVLYAAYGMLTPADTAAPPQPAGHSQAQAVAPAAIDTKLAQQRSGSSASGGGGNSPHSGSRPRVSSSSPMAASGKARSFRRSSRAMSATAPRDEQYAPPSAAAATSGSAVSGLVRCWQRVSSGQRMLGLGVCCHAVGVLIVAVVPDTPIVAFIAGRVFQGIGSALVWTFCAVLCSDMFHVAEHEPVPSADGGDGTTPDPLAAAIAANVNLSLSIMTIGSTVGELIAPGMGAALFSAFGVQYAYAAIAVFELFVLAVFAACVLLVDVSQPLVVVVGGGAAPASAVHTRVDVPPTADASEIVVIVPPAPHLAVIKEQSVASARSPESAAVGASTPVPLAPADGAAAAPVSARSIMFDPIVLALSIGIFLMDMHYGVQSVIGPLFMSYTLGRSESSIGEVLTGYSAGLTVCTVFLTLVRGRQQRITTHQSGGNKPAAELSCVDRFVCWLVSGLDSYWTLPCGLLSLACVMAVFTYPRDAASGAALGLMGLYHTWTGTTTPFMALCTPQLVLARCRELDKLQHPKQQPLQQTTTTATNPASSSSSSSSSSSASTDGSGSAATDRAMTVFYLWWFAGRGVGVILTGAASDERDANQQQMLMWCVAGAMLLFASGFIVLVKRYRHPYGLAAITTAPPPVAVPPTIAAAPPVTVATVVDPLDDVASRTNIQLYSPAAAPTVSS